MKLKDSIKAFGSVNSVEKMIELVKCYNELKEQPTSTTLANTFCLNSWHLIDWIAIEYKQLSTKKERIAYKETLCQMCNHLNIMHDIANSSKHLTLSNEKADIKESRKQQGPFTNVFSKHFKQTSLIIEFNDGRQLDFNKIANEVLDFWIYYFKNNLGVTISIPFPFEE